MPRSRWIAQHAAIYTYYLAYRMIEAERAEREKTKEAAAKGK